MRNVSVTWCMAASRKQYLQQF